MFEVSSGLATLGPEALKIIGLVERQIAQWAQEIGALEYSYPALVSVEELSRVDYFEDFPHLGTMACTIRHDRLESEYANRKEVRTNVPGADLEDARFALPSAACYGAYFALRGRVLSRPTYITTLARCFRHEREYVALERLWSFQMRELVCIGDAQAVQQHLSSSRSRIEAFTRAIGLPLTIAAATDPLVEQSSARAAMPPFPVKEELVYRGNLAIASVHFHHNFFGERCEIKLPDGSPAFTGCVAFGLERWLAALVDHFDGHADRIAAALESAYAEADGPLPPSALERDQQDGSPESSPVWSQAKKRTADCYNATADHYDDAPNVFMVEPGRRTVAQLGLSPGAVVLDVGSGTGHTALPAAEIVGPTGRVIGIDLADQLLARGRAKAAQRGLRNVDFRVADMEALDFPDGDFDAITCTFAIFFVEDMVAQVRRFWRMLRPGGQLAITVWGKRFFEPMKAVFWSAVRDVRPDLYRAYHPWDRIDSEEAITSILLAGGVQQAEISHITPTAWVQRLDRPEDWWLTVLGLGMRWTIDQLTPAEVARVREANVEWLRTHNVSIIETNVIYAVATRQGRAP
ncbi:MAG TPA: methyltransferase domain-containing protein [Kofleriaceae bacterium]|nr:methyltransferase domain-containing protein [Kofleriaceae bacterium]